MTNIKAEIKGNVLTLTVDLSKRHGKSSSGKTTIIASSGGNQATGHPSGAVYGLNVYSKTEE